MKILKQVLIVVATMVAIPLVAALFIDSKFVIEREVTVNKSRSEVFAFAKLLKNQERYSKWAMLDPKAKITYRGTDGEEGAVMAWESESQDVGKGEQEITKLIPDEKIEVVIRMQEPFESNDPAFTTFEDAGEGKTKVTATYQGKFNYPTNLLCLFVKDMIGNDMAGNLERLKEVMEK